MIRTKFPGYYDKIYSPGERYRDLWANKKGVCCRCAVQEGARYPF